MDKATGVVAMERASGPCSIVAIESFRFLAPLSVGQELLVYGRVASVGRTSMRVELKGVALDPQTRERQDVCEGVFIAVALDDQQQPKPVPDLP